MCIFKKKVFSQTAKLSLLLVKQFKIHCLTLKQPINGIY